VTIPQFLQTIAKQGGMSFANNFIVEIEDLPEPLNGSLESDYLAMFCDEAQLPNINTATGTQNGLYTGVGSVDYPHTRIFTELQLGFALTANLDILKFLNFWYGSIFGESNLADGTITPEIVGEGGTKTENRTTRVAYKDDYAATIKITKSETGPQSTVERQPITYVLEKAFPYAIDAVPLQFGSSQITKVTAQFKYQRHYTINRNIKAVRGDVSSLYKKSILPSFTGASANTIF
tara:strand:+ start:3431 stop:4135 length:705 start_codon:yes stop_codon:yes gene_type:complete